MANYVDEVITEKKFKYNVVIKIGATYYCIRQPDSGLTVSAPYDGMVGSLVVNPAAIDIKKVNTTIATYSFSLLDKSGIISALVVGTGAALVGQNVTIWLGRSRKRATDPANDFAGYYQLPITRIKKIGHEDNRYQFSSSEDTDKIDKPIYAATSALSVNITSGTTTITMRDSISSFPAAGQVRVDNEIFSYTSKNSTQFLGVVRGEQGTTPAAHTANTNCYQSETITGNPLDILLKILISNGGLGTYDTLKSGLGIANALIDVAGIEATRDSLFLTKQIKLEMYNVSSALKFLEAEILQFFNLRFTYSNSAKLTLAVLDKAVFSPIVETINEDTITTYPKWSVDDTKIVNKIKINWGYDEATNTYMQYSELTDAASIAAYGPRSPLTFNFKGIKSSLDGAALVTDFARVLFARFSTPVAEVEVKTHIDRSLKNIGDKVYVESTKIPAPAGNLVFASDMEVTKRAINYQTSEVAFTLAFTSFTKFRSGYIAPSDLIQYVHSQKQVTVPNGRSAKYRVGWYMRLWNTVTKAYEVDSPNKIISFLTGEAALLLESGGDILLEDGSGLDYEQAPGDYIIFENNWSTTLTTNHRLKFANYSEVEDTQKRYSFISDSGNNFADGKTTYKVTY